ncbi:MAG: hypothetical protein K9N48_01280 [Verrucomicrobia bacterium]|nr:hypothetical protein [Verrucomicrobiota bacterium]MCF7707284.1 hypothetical protein [Verrucomicrobiota bacterium]
MNKEDEIFESLRSNLSLYREILSVIEGESRALQNEDSDAATRLSNRKRALLPQLEDSVDILRNNRMAWHRINLAERSESGNITEMIRQCQDLIMKIIVLDRENEQLLLRRGLVPPQCMSSVSAPARPNFVADLYRRRGST